MTTDVEDQVRSTRDKPNKSVEQEEETEGAGGAVGGAPEKPSEDPISIGPVSTEERSRLLQVVNNFSECFAWNGELGMCDLVQHRIELTTDVPVQRPAYKVAHADRKFIEEEVRDMLAKGVIEPSVSPYAAGVVLVPKKSGEVRFCVDYRGLNLVTKSDHFPLPLARSEIFDTLGEAKIFSCLDCQQGYWQVGVAEEDRPKTAFRCFLGLFQFKRVPFGLKTAPATYQRLMAHVLSGYTGKFCHCFIDDIIVFSATFEEHLIHLHLVLSRLRDAGIKLKPSKCVLAKEKVHYLGHVISPGEIRPDPENVAKIRDLEPPSTVKQVRMFLGMASYYRSFVKDFSKRARPLTELTKKGVQLRWGPEEEAAFTDLKDTLTSEPVLALPDFTMPFVLMTDGSSTGLGAVLGQLYEGEARERVIGYASRRTTKLEESYSACELECIALIWATKHFRDYLLGRQVKVLTDHWALKWLQDLRNPNPRLQRWRIALQEFDIEISHKPGKHHQNADFLSRMYEGQPAPEPDDDERMARKNSQGRTGMDVVAVTTRNQAREGRRTDAGAGTSIHPSVAPSNRSDRGPQKGRTEIAGQAFHSGAPVTGREPVPPGGRQALVELQRNDDDCKQLIQAVRGGSQPPPWARSHTFRITDDGVLERVGISRQGEEVWQIVLPKCLVKSAVEDAHAGHLKLGKTLGNLRRSFFFKNMYTVCSEYIDGCPTCQQKDLGRRKRAPLGDMPRPLGAWHTVAVDVLGPLPQTRTGKKYVIVLTDYLTRFVLAIATKDQTAATTAQALMEKFLEYGLPERLITDNGPNFRSELLAAMCRNLQTAHLFSTPYHPQFDGLCERFNRTLTSMLRGFVDTHQRDWDQYLPYLMHAYRAAPQESTGEAPFFLMFGRPCRAPLDIHLTAPRLDYPAAAQEVERTKPLFVSRMSKAFAVVQDQLERAHAKQKRAHDRKSKERKFKIGDEVLLLDERVGEGQTKKLHPPWKPGFRVVEVVGPLNYNIEHPNRRGKILRVHVNRLKPQKPEYVWPQDDELGLPQMGEPDHIDPGQQANRWLQEEKMRYRPHPRDHSPVSDCSSEEEAATSAADERGNAPRGPTPHSPHPVPAKAASARPTFHRPKAMPSARTNRHTPFETPILRKSERLKRRREMMP